MQSDCIILLVQAQRITTHSVTARCCVQYYQHVSASIDGDDYFELVLRNVWHLDGGNTSRRLLVTHEDGTQTVETIGDDFEVSRDDLKVRAHRHVLVAHG